MFSGFSFSELWEMDIRDLNSWYNEALKMWANERIRAINNIRVAPTKKAYNQLIGGEESLISEIEWKER